MQLLLPSAKSAVLIIGKPSWFEKFEKLQGALFVFGVLVVLLGGLDLMGRVETPTLGDDTLRQAFAPAILAE